MSLAEFDVTGQKVLIVGAGRGIGKGIALAFTEGGADVAVASLTEATVGKVAEEIRAMGGTALPVTGDATKAADMDRIASKVLAEFGHIDTLVTCVGDSIRKPVVKLHASAHVASGSPPNPKVRYHIEYSLDSGKTWLSIVKGRAIPRRGDEPGDFWSQSFSYGSSAIRAAAGKTILVRFRNDAGKRYLRAEAHLIQATGQSDPVKVTYAWTDASGLHQGSHVFRGKGEWKLATGKQVRTRWVQFEPVR